MVKQIIAGWVFAILAFGSTAEAQTQPRFDWQFYDRAPVLVLVNNDDLTVVRVLTGEEGIANKKLMEASLCLVFYGGESCDQRFLDQVVTYLRESKWQWKVYAQGNIDLDYGLSHGVVVKGVRQVAVTKAPPVIHTKDKTGKRLVSPRARLLDSMEIPGTGRWVNVVIFEECYNTSGENAEVPAPPQAVATPSPPPQISRKAPPVLMMPPLSPRIAPPLAPLFQPYIPQQPEPVRSSGFCGKKCKWTLVAVGGGAVAGYATWYYWPCIVGTRR